MSQSPAFKKVSDKTTTKILTVDVWDDCLWVVLGDTENGRIWKGKLSTFDDIRKLQLEHGVSDDLVGIDAGSFRSEIFQVCSEYNWLALIPSQVGDTDLQNFSSVHITEVAGKRSARFCYYAGEELKKRIHLAAIEPNFQDCEVMQLVMAMIHESHERLWNT